MYEEILCNCSNDLMRIRDIVLCKTCTCIHIHVGNNEHSSASIRVHHGGHGGVMYGNNATSGCTRTCH